jgi:hypothetical protein
MLDAIGNIKPDVSYSFTSSNPAVAAVDQNGTVYPNGNLTSGGFTDIDITVSVMGVTVTSYVLTVHVIPTMQAP